MYFRNKFDEEFLFLANDISPKGGSVRLDNPNPLYFIFEKPPYDEWGRRILVKPLLLYNKITTSNKNDKVVGDWVVYCANRSDTRILCSWVDNYRTEQQDPVTCDLGFININADIAYDVDSIIYDDFDDSEYEDPDYAYDDYEV